MAERLTQRAVPFTGTINPQADLVHVVDVSDTTQDAAGSSYPVEIYKIIDSLYVVADGAISITLDNANCPIGQIPHFRINDATLKTITIPTDAILTNAAIGYSFEFTQVGVGQVQILASGVTLLSADGATITRTQYSHGRCEKVAANTWEISGDIL